jgi:hypothetical protein
MTNSVLPSRTYSKVSDDGSLAGNRPQALHFTDTRSITEPAGALGLAALKRYILKNNLVGAEKKFVAVVSGANMNFDRLRFVAERAELGEGREALLSVEIPERPGRQVLPLLGIYEYLSIAHLPVSLFYILLSIHVLSPNFHIATIRPRKLAFSSHSSWSPLRGRGRWKTCFSRSRRKICAAPISATTKWPRATPAT